MIHETERKLFSAAKLRDALKKNIGQSEKETYAIPRDQFLAETDDRIIEHVYTKLATIPLEIFQEVMDIEETEIREQHRKRKNRVRRIETRILPAVKYTVKVPFRGEPELWEWAPFIPTGNRPRGIVDAENSLVWFSVECPSDARLNGSHLKQKVDENLALISQYIDKSRQEIEADNVNLREMIAGHVRTRRERLNKHTAVAEFIGIPLESRDGVPDFKELPIRTQIVEPLTATTGKTPEPGINFEVYELILNAIRHQGCTFETTRETYAVHGEEDLRNIILANLNGYFEGDATGETFRKSGKTDIRIEDKDRMAFIGECKVWSGPKDVIGDIDQLLGYSTWRDCKTALVYFNKTVAGFKAIQDKMEAALSGHPNYIEPVPTDKAGEWRFKIRSSDDPDRELTVHVFLFDLYVKPEDKADTEVSG